MAVSKDLESTVLSLFQLFTLVRTVVHRLHVLQLLYYTTIVVKVGSCTVTIDYTTTTFPKSIVLNYNSCRIVPLVSLSANYKMEHIEYEEPPKVIEGDSNNSTKINPEEAPPGKREKFRRLREYNRGMWNGPKRENKEQVRRQDNLHRYDSIASTLPLTKYQRKRGRQIIDDISFQKMGLSIELVIFSVCVVVANQDCPDTRYWPSEKAKNNDSEFEEMASELSLSYREQLSTVQKIMSMID